MCAQRAPKACASAWWYGSTHCATRLSQCSRLPACKFGFLLGGAIVVETVFAWPGLGRLLVDSVSYRDYPVIQAEILLFSFEFVIINLVVDLLYAVVNPEIRLQ